MEDLELAQERVVVLLRASSKQQTDREHDFDIPQQKAILLPFVESKGWKLIRTFTEGGVSGYKVSANNRDAIQDIKKMADRHEIDRVVIYMSDRLGRIADETPLIVSYLNKRGVSVFSYTEGEISTKDHTDKLITYIRYWQAEGESIKTSKRVSDAIGAAVEAGRYRGGAAPFGYKMVNNGRNNYKGKPVLDIEIDEEQAAVVRLIYKLARENNYGYRQIAKYLNDKGYKSKQGNLWGCNQVGQILYHTLYKGYYELKEQKGCRHKAKKVSPLMPNLIIIPEDEWDETHKAMQKRSSRSKGSKNTSHGTMLLSGLLFCGYCGRKFTSFQSKSKTVNVDGEEVRKFIPKYRCSSFMYPQEDACKGQSTYSATKVEKAVINALKRYMSTLSTQDLTVSYLERIDEQIKSTKADLTKKQIAQTRVLKELSALKDEVVKSLIGESKFDCSMLQEMLSKKEMEVKSNIADVENKERELLDLTESRQNVYNLDSKMRTWETDFEQQSVDGQKAMLYQVVDRIDIFRDRVEIHVNIKMEMFKQGLSDRLVAPVETEEWIAAEPVELVEAPDLVATPSVLVPQHTFGDVNCTSLAA
jgi:resolvase domain protein